jgi:hypothetical protein
MSRQRAVRDAIIATGAAVAAVGFLVWGVSVILDMIAIIRVGFAPTSYDVGKGLDVGHDLVLAAAFVLVTFAFAGRIEARERRLAAASVVAAAGFAVWIAAQALYGVSEPEPQGMYQLVAIDALGALAATTLVATATAAAVAFRRAASSSPGDQSQRDGLLGWAALGLALSLALLTAAGIVDLDTLRLFGDGNDGLRLSTIGLAIGIGGGAVAAVAFIFSRRGQRRSTAGWTESRDALLAGALALLVVGFAFSGLGDGRVANASARDHFTPQLFATSHWVEAASAWILCACTALVAIGFLVSSLSRPQRITERAI